MDIEKLKAEFEKLKYVEDKLEYLNFDEHLGCYVEKNNGMPVGLAAWVNGALYGFEQAAKSQAVPEWKDYSQQSPRIDGRYQIFINGEQLAADWKSPFGFADPIEGVALIQDLITHWAVLSADPVIMEQSHE